MRYWPCVGLHSHSAIRAPRHLSHSRLPRPLDRFEPRRSVAALCRREIESMESRIYSVLFQFNQGIEQALAALDTLEKMDLAPPEYIQQIRVRFQEVAANANSHFTDRVSKQEIRKQLECQRERRQQEEEANPDRIYLRVATAEDIRPKPGLPTRAVILPWTRLDDDRAL